MQKALRPMRKRMSIAVLTVLMVLAVAEVLSAIAFTVINGGVFYRRSRPMAVPKAAEVSESTVVTKTILHPVIGFVNRPGISAGEIVGGTRLRAMGSGNADPRWASIQANGDGFFSPGEYPATSQENEFVVGVFGGSVAQWLAVQAGDHLAAEIEGLVGFEESHVRVLPFAQGGFKYPQQLQVLSLFASLGQRFDLIIDVSGFNELALGGFNESHAVEPGWPSMMHLGRLTTLLDLEGAPMDALRLLERVRSDTNVVAELRQRVDESRLASFWLVRSLRLRFVEGRLEAGRQGLTRVSASRNVPLIASRPSHREPNIEMACQKAVLQWRRGVSMMHSLAKGMNAQFVGVIQPNQYHSGHRFSPEEKKVALRKGSVFREPVQIGYPLLEPLVAELRDEGVVMVDAIGVFDTEPRPVFADSCCHFNELGNRMLVDRIMEELGPVLEADESATP